MMDRGACLGCGRRLPGAFLDLGAMPLANAYVRPGFAQEPEPRFPLAVVHCAECHLVQLTDPVPSKDLFGEYLYFSSYSETFLAHAQEMAATISERFGLHAGSRVLEIASNDGYLLRFFRERGIPVLGVEPARNVAEVALERGIPTLVRFFGSEIVPEVLDTFGRADVIVGNNVLAHVPEINAFLAAVRACLKPEGVAIFEFPYLKELFEKTEFDTIYHEHVFYLSLTAVSSLAGRAGLSLFDVTRESVHGGSLRVYLQSSRAWPPTGRSEELIAEELACGILEETRHAAFSRTVSTVRDELRGLLSRLKGAGRRLAAYGAPAKGNTLLNYCGIGTETLEFTVDRSPYKQGLLLPGSRIPIRPTEDLLRERPDYALVLPWNLIDEIRIQQGEYVRRGGRFLVPVPVPREIAA